MLAVVPATQLEQLDLGTPCPRPLAALLHRCFPNLKTLHIWGGQASAADVDWDCGRWGQAVARCLRRLRIDTSSYEQHTEASPYSSSTYDTLECEAHPLPEPSARALQAASSLDRLALVVEWSDATALLCSALPSLQWLR